MEDALIRQAQAGDQFAFRQLVDRYTPLLWGTAQALLPDRGMAEDAVQETWIDVWRGLPGFQLHRPFRPWLLTIVSRRCWMAARRRVLPMVPLESEAFDALPGADAVSEHLLRLESDAAVRAALGSLPEDQQRVLALRYFTDLDVSEIALVMGTPVGTVKSRLHRALGSLRARLQSEFPRAAYREKHL
jgi:RNA polymerase sigma-70 factor (ECF subfamily)